MDYRPLGRTGVQVSPLCLGAMMFRPWGNDDRADATGIIHRALDAGINFVDTADVYSAGASEEIVGQALRGRRDDVFLATKFFMPMSDSPNDRGGSRRWIIREVENSRERGPTLVLVTHDTAIARRAQREPVMSNGHLTIRRDSPNREGHSPHAARFPE
jgi:aryl-alcohol dehydrogenase-like predicted oxidoreductase